LSSCWSLDDCNAVYADQMKEKSARMSKHEHGIPRPLYVISTDRNVINVCTATSYFELFFNIFK
jgi:hypothetical protein